MLVTFLPWPLTLSGLFCCWCFCCCWITSARKQPIWHGDWDSHCCLCCSRVSSNNRKHDFGPVCSWLLVFWRQRCCFRRHFAVVALRVISVKEQASYAQFFFFCKKMLYPGTSLQTNMQVISFLPLSNLALCNKNRLWKKQDYNWEKNDGWISKSYTVVNSWRCERFALFGKS